MLRIVASRQLSGGSATRAGLSISRRLGAFDIGADAQYDTSTKDIIVGLRASFSFGRGLGGWRVSPPGLARGGSLVAVAFRDLDGDGRMETNEPPIEGVAFRGGTGDNKTGPDGRALITGLGDGRPTQVSMLTDSLPDPYLAPVKPGVEVVPRPGRTAVVMFPVATVSEVEGHAFFKGVDSHRAVSNVQLQLVADDDTVTSSWRRCRQGPTGCGLTRSRRQSLESGWRRTCR
jgi:hypothetical protein